MRFDEARILHLYALNIALQLFDGVATYQGTRLGWQEANPLLAYAFAHLGVGPALLLIKTNACSLLTVLHRHAHHPSVPPALAFLAGTYGLFSFVPWMAKFVGLLL